MNKILDKYLAERKQPQDKDVDDVKGSQPKKYFKGLDKDDKKARANYFARGGGRGKAPGDDDPDAKTTPSKHTKKYKQLFGDNVDEKVVGTGEAISKIFKTKNKKEIDGIANLMSMTNVKVLQSMQKQNPKGFSRMASKMGELPAMEEIEKYDTLYDTFVEAEELEMIIPMRNLLQTTRKQVFDAAKKSGLNPKKIGSGSSEKLELKGTEAQHRKFQKLFFSQQNLKNDSSLDEAISFGFDTMKGANEFRRKFPDSERVQIVKVDGKKKHIVTIRDSSFHDTPRAASIASKIAMKESPPLEESLEEKKKDMTAISSWKKKLQKVKGLTKQQIQMLNTLPTPVITSLINQIGMVVASNDMAEDGHTDVISAKNKVKIAMKALNIMNQELNKLNDEDDLPSWWTDKVAIAVNNIDDMSDYLDMKVENVRDIFKESDVKGLQEKAEKALKNKAKETGMPLGILRKVFQRGVKAWQSGHRPGTNAVQWGLARVNSFVTKGKGTWGKADSDLAAKVRKSEEIEEKAPNTADAMKRFKAGKAGFTDKAHLKAKGLIPRADGTKRKSEKYK